MKKALIRISLLLAMLLVIAACFTACGPEPVPNEPGNSGSTTGSSGSGDEGGGDEGAGGTEYTVKFDMSAAQNKVDIPDQKVKENGKVTAPDVVPSRKGSEFLGWCVGGNQNQVWDFDSDVVTGDITLVAVFSRASTGGPSDCEHVFEVTEFVAPTCEMHGRRVEKCTLCRTVVRYNKDNDPTLRKLEHLELEEFVDSTCALDGYRTIYCPNGCGLTLTMKVPSTGDHQYDPLGWKSVIKPTLYVNGRMENACTGCGGAVQVKEAPYNATEEDLYDEKVNISFYYTGGKYVNEKLVNVSNLGKIMVSSFFDGTKGPYANDGNTTTFWNADTYVDGAKFTEDWLELELPSEYEIGAIKLTLPNYTAWELGEECYVSYDLEYWDSAKGEWVYICEVTDKEATSVGISCEFMKVLDEPITTGKIRASVTHATRYAPAVIYEIEAFAKTAETERIPTSAITSATVSVSGKYNEWATGADAIKDGTTATYWYTDKRHRPNNDDHPWALYEFPTDMYIACVQFSVHSVTGRAMTLEVYKNGEWVKVGTYSVPTPGETNEYAISNSNDICVFNINIEDTVSKIKLSITREPQYWTSYVYDIIPYTIAEVPFGEACATGCLHSNPSKGEVVAPSCGTPGYTVMNCVCGAIMKTKATDALAHDWGKYSVETAATATSIGTKVSTCRREGCGAVNTIKYEEKYDAPVVTPYLHNAPAAWAQTFDDGNYLDTYVWANEHLIKYGARATVMMSITYSDGYVSVWQDHFTRGVFDLGSHSYNHTTIYAGQAGSSLLSEVIGAQYWFRHNFKNQSLITFAAPLGAISTSVAQYLTGPLAANRNGGDTGIFYNTPDQLISREVWGDLNSYISKADQTEGIYVFVNKNGGGFVAQTTETPRVDKNGEPVLDKDGNPVVDVTTEYIWSADVNAGNAGPAILLNAKGKYVETETPGVNLVFDWNEMTFVEKGYNDGTYVFVEEDYRYDFHETGSYNYVNGKFEFVNDDSGEYRLLKTTVGSYEKGVEQLVSVGGFTVECLHSLGLTNVIYSSYESTISKLEHLTRFGVWAPSYNELIKYLKEAQNATLIIKDRTEDTIVLSVTDSLDNFMFNQAITLKVDIPDSWKSVSVTQGDVSIPLVTAEEYKQTRNMASVSCIIEDGYLYVDVVPDAGDVVITMGEKDDSVNDYKEKVTVTFNPGEGVLSSTEYEMKVVIGKAIMTLPTPVREGYSFLGWFLDEELTEAVAAGTTTFEEDTVLFAKWKEIPLCKDGSYNHNWGNWLPSTVVDQESRTCRKCGAVEVRVTDTTHEHTYKEEIIGSTCTVEGYTVYTCTLCGDSYVDNYTDKKNHVGVGACEQCGVGFDHIMADWIIENGTYSEEDNTYSIIDEIEYDGAIQYIELQYAPDKSQISLIYNTGEVVGSTVSVITLYLGDIENGNVEWSLIYDGTIMSGAVKAGDVTSETAELSYAGFNGEDSQAATASEQAAKLLKSAVWFANQYMQLSGSALFDMTSLGFGNLISTM